MEEENLQSLTQKFKNSYQLKNSETDYLKQLMHMEEAHIISNDAKLTMLVEEVDFFIYEYIRSANMFRFTNDLLNKDRARVISDQLYLLHQFFTFLLEQTCYSKSVFCDENTLTLLFESAEKMEGTLDKYAKYVFQ